MKIIHMLDSKKVEREISIHGWCDLYSENEFNNFLRKCRFAGGEEDIWEIVCDIFEHTSFSHLKNDYYGYATGCSLFVDPLPSKVKNIIAFILVNYCSIAIIDEC